MTVTRRLSYHMLVLLVMERNDAVFDSTAVVVAVKAIGAEDAVLSSSTAIPGTFASRNRMQNYCSHWKLWLLRIHWLILKILKTS